MSTYYIDIEAIPAFKSFDEADDRTQDLFIKKCRAEIVADGGQTDPHYLAQKLYPEKAGLLAEFNRIVCVSLGIITTTGGIYIRSFTGSENEILIQLSGAIKECYSLCAHFGKGFDYPVLCRKYVMHGLELPRVLNIGGLKPWEVPLLDTQDMWKFGDMRHSCSLDLLAHCFGLPSPKEEMDGSQVGYYFYHVEGGLAQIVKYCEADVRTLINVHRKMTYQPVIL